MESKYTRINFIVIVVFIASMIYTTLQLFSLQDELIIGVSALTTDSISELSSVLSTVYITVAVSLIAGLIAILLNIKTEKAGGVQMLSSTSHKKNEKVNGDTSQESKSDEKLDLSTVQNALKNNSDKKKKYTAVLTAICKRTEVGQGAIYLTKETKEARVAELYTSYAFHIPETETLAFTFGEGLIGQVAVEGNTLNIDDIPENYINIVSGLGSASPKHLLITPLLKNKKVVGVVELASFTPFSKEEEKWIKESLNLLADVASKKEVTTSSSKKKVEPAESTPKKKKAQNKNE